MQGWQRLIKHHDIGSPAYVPETYGESFPVAAKDMANLRGRKVGLPYTLNLATPEGEALDKMKSEMKKAGLL